MRPSGIHRALWVLSICTSFGAAGLAAQGGPETQRCLTREQLNIEPTFSACPPLVDEASVSDNSFISKLYLDRGHETYSIRWQGPDYFDQRDYTLNPDTGAYEGFCGSRFCELYPPAWVQQEHWKFIVGTLLAGDAGTWTYSELRDGDEFQSRTFEVQELTLRALSGADQMGLADTVIPLPLVLKLESFEGTGIEGESIGWAIDGPKGAKRAAVTGIGGSSQTDPEGVDQATIRLGSKPGVYSVTLNNRRMTEASQPTFTFTAIDDIEDTDPETEHPDFEEAVGYGQQQHCDLVGNPISLSAGNKFQREVDLPETGLSPIEFIRFHNSLGFLSRSFANYWTHSYDRYVEVPVDPRSDPVKVVRPDGRKINFAWNGSSYDPYPGVYSTLEQTAGGWRFTDDNLTVENFDPEGLLVDITDLAGRSQQATHDADGRLLRVDSNLGDVLQFDYDSAGRLTRATDASGRSWVYRYGPLGRLIAVDRPDGTSRQYHYEDLRHAYALTGITLEDGERYSHYRYDEEGRAIASWHADDIDRVDIQYDANGDRIVLDPLGNATVYQTRIANKRGFLDGISGPVCSQGCGQTDLQYSYDADWNVTRKVAYGVTTEFGSYDAKGQPGYVLQAAGTPDEKRIDYEYDPGFRNRITRMTESSVYPGAYRVTTRDFDFGGKMLEETVAGFDPSGAPVSRTVAYRYDGPFGQLSAIDGPREDVLDVTIYEFYPDSPTEGANRARLKAVVDPAGIRIRDNLHYSSTGKLLAEERPNGLSVQYEYYPGNDRVRSVTEAGGGQFNRTQWEYFPTGEVSRLVVDDETGEEIITQFHYDNARRLYWVESRVSGGTVPVAEQWVNFEFDAAGNITAERWESRDSPQDDYVISRVFDAYDRIDRLTTGGITEDLDYNPDGTLGAKTDGKLNTTRYSYDAFKRLILTEQVGRLTTTLAYDTHGNLERVVDPENHATQYSHDDLGNRVREDNPDSGVTRFIHDEAGQVVSQVDAKGQITQFSYDAAGRLVRVDRDGADYDVDYRYDGCAKGLGRLCEVSTGWGHAIEYGWNELGERVAVTAPEGAAGFGYGPQGTLRSITYPSGRTVRYEPDDVGRTGQIRLQVNGQPETILVDEIAYSALGRPIRWRLANGLETVIELDARQRPERIDVAGAWVWQAGGYDANDNLLNLVSTFDAVSYDYDPLDRLTAAVSASQALGFSYDAVGNRLSAVADGLAVYGSYQPGSNRLASFGDRQYVLDANGNTTSVGVAQQPGTVFNYAPHNRLLNVLDEASAMTLAEYRYDALGQRVRKIRDGETRHFLYGLEGELLAVTDGAGSVLHEYVYLQGRPIADLSEVVEAAQAAQSETVIDDGDAAVYGGNWQTKSHPLAIGGSYLQNRKRDGRALYWYMDEAGTTGPHDVFVRWLNPEGNGSSTQYVVRVSDEEPDPYGGLVTVNHADHEDGEWVLLGNYDIKPYDANSRQFVTLGGDINRGLEGIYLEGDAVRIVPTSVPTASSDIHYIHGDHLGTPQAVTDENGEVVWTARYQPFGAATVDEDPDGDGVTYELNLRFPGQYHDAETGLHYNYFRTYDPSKGRYQEPDPIGLAGGLNGFAYGNGNPLRFSDPLGLDAELCQRPFYPIPVPYARHCFVRYSGGDTSSFGPNGSGNDPAPEWWPKDCGPTEGEENDDCVRREMKACEAGNYDFIGFNCCHCVERAFRMCGLGVQRNDWPNWPINPGPLPGESGYSPDPRQVVSWP